MTKKIYYGYVIAISCLIMTFFFVGLGNSTNSLYIVPVTEHFGFSRGGFSLIFSIISLTSLFTSLSYGGLVNILGIKRIIGLGTFSIASAFFIFYNSSTLLEFYLGAFLVGFGVNVTSTSSVSILVNNWFTEKKGLILGLIFAGSGLGGSFFSFIIGKSISINGFSKSYLYTSILLFILAIPITLLIKMNPDESNNIKIRSKTHDSLNKKARIKIFKQTNVFMGIISFFLIGVIIHPILTNVPAILIDRGYNSDFATKIYGTIYLILSFAKILLGWINDNYGVKTSMFVGLGSFIIGAVLLIGMNNHLTAWLFAFVYGVSTATLSVLLPLFTEVVVGKDNLSNFIGIFMASMSAGITLGIPIISYSYDFFNSYNQVISLYLIIGIIALALSIISINKSRCKLSK